MEAPPVQYVTTSDGYRIAYCVSGAGRPVVLLPNVWSHIQLFWRVPWRRSLFEALALRFQLIQFDGRGQGLSTRGLKADHSADSYLKDVHAVVERLGLSRFVLMARNQFCHVAVNYALRHREQVEALVLGNPAIDLYRGFDDLRKDRWEIYTETIARLSSLPTGSAQLASEFRHAVNQDDHIRLVEALRTITTPSNLAQLDMPAMVVISSPSPLSSQEPGLRLAAEIPHAQIVSIDDPAGSSGFFSAGPEPPLAVHAIEQFLEGVGRDDGAPAAVATDLSPREVEVLRLVAAGRSNAQIADELVISQNTVIRHVSNIFGKIGAANRAEAASYATRNGIA
jgi:DNA-binding CsgD family transcriptional regulator/pimeloyl-ACP methyl ester carboxylesterase